MQFFVFSLKMILLLLVSFVVVVVGYAWFHTLYWKRRGINGPTPQIFIGNLNELDDFIGKPIPLKLAEWTKKYGKFYGIQRGHRNALVLSDPKLAKEVFVEQFENFHERDLIPVFGNPDKRAIAHVFASRGIRWKRLRALTSLAFTTKSLKKVFPIVIDHSDRLCQGLEEDLKSSQIVNIAQNLKEFTAGVILQSAFGRDESRQSIRTFIDGVLKHFTQVQGKIAPIAWTLPPLGPALFTLNQLMTFLFNKFMFAFMKQIKGEINERKEAKDKELDEYESKNFIDLLIEAQSDDVVLENAGNYDKKNSHIDKHLSKDEILGTCFIFLGAGFDTTANTLGFTFYHLAKHPEIQEKIREEIKEHCPDEDLNYDSLSQLKYLDAIMKETLRLHPIATVATSRRCSHSTKIGNLQIEQGTDIMLDVISMHKDKEIWGEDSEEYKPQRWLSSNPQLGNFLGFGDGLRICLGMRFAVLEFKVACIKVLKKYRVIEIPETKEAEHVIGFLMSPKSVKVKLEPL